MVRPDIPYGLSGQRVSIGICRAGPQAGWYVACFRYVTPNMPDWFMVKFGDGHQGFTDPDAEMDFDDVAELDDYWMILKSPGLPSRKRRMHYGKNFRRIGLIPNL